MWDAISGRLSSTGFVSALAFAPSQSGLYFAGTDDGKVFKTVAGVFTNITNNLTTLVGSAFRVNGITVDPNNANTVYVMLGVPVGTMQDLQGASGIGFMLAVRGWARGRAMVQGRA